jgi:hypothetical protein
MITYVEDEGSAQYVRSIEFIEHQIEKALHESECDLGTHPQATREIKGFLAKLINEYESYIKFAVEINPFCLKEIKELREAQRFWVDWRAEHFKKDTL